MVVNGALRRLFARPVDTIWRSGTATGVGNPPAPLAERRPRPGGFADNRGEGSRRSFGPRRGPGAMPVERPCRLTWPVLTIRLQRESAGGDAMSVPGSDEKFYELLKRELFTAVVGDVLDQMGFRRQFLPFGIAPVRPEMTLAGRAMPVLGVDLGEECGAPSPGPLADNPFGLLFR